MFFTGAILGAATTTPVAMLLIDHVTAPLGLPAVVANTAAMSIGTTISFVVCRYLPWMHLPADAPVVATAPTTIAGPPTVTKDAIWTMRRIVADFTETPFYANELASVGVILGVVGTFMLNPLSPAYGSGLLPHVLFAQALTSAIGVVVWRHLYRGGGWAPTYISVVSVAPRHRPGLRRRRCVHRRRRRCRSSDLPRHRAADIGPTSEGLPSVHRQHHVDGDQHRARHRGDEEAGGGRPRNASRRRRPCGRKTPWSRSHLCDQGVPCGAAGNRTEPPNEFDLGLYLPFGTRKHAKTTHAVRGMR